ncbi:hypothetical protein BBJ28_00004117 [Nothophytophthora sp. Chile5]|nr:hypothetical protein BBJ28_00004117 [Nothophytophthora sp. Chile5]
MSAKSTRASPPFHATRAMLDTLLMNSTLRKQFAYYSMAGNVTNLVSITRSNFVKFVKDYDEVEKLVETHVIARAKVIQVQHLAPDLSQTHVMKLLKEHVWQLKQIFSHFGIQSLVEVDSKVRLDMKEFLTFARAFSE